jgi:hypothetical protein
LEHLALQGEFDVDAEARFPAHDLVGMAERDRLGALDERAPHELVELE